MGRLRLAALLLLYWSSASPVRADIDPAEYEPKTSIRSEKERQRMKVLLEADMKAEIEQQRQEAEAETRRLAEEKAAWESLPYPVRLTGTRCTACHIADNFTKQRHNRIGWELVVLRMHYLNDAKLDEGERSVIAAHLAQNYPAIGIDAATEALMQMLAILPLPGLWLAWRGARARRRRMCAFMQNAAPVSAALPSASSSQNGQKLTRGK